MVINPKLLTSHPKTVRLFVFQHECGHHHVGASELSVDCWAVRRGVSDGWLDRVGLTQVCRSFRGAPATATHPSAERCCRNLDKCFARAEVEKASTQRPAVSQGSAEPPQLLVGLTLIREGVSRPLVPAGVSKKLYYSKEKLLANGDRWEGNAKSQDAGTRRPLSLALRFRTLTAGADGTSQLGLGSAPI